MKKSIFLIFCILTILLTASVFSSCKKEVQYDVIFMVDGTQYSKLTTSGNRVFPLPPEPTKAGYVFKGWYYDEGYYLEAFDNTAWENTPLMNNVTVYAKWRSEGACPDGTCIPGEFSVIEVPTITLSYSKFIAFPGV